jgi:hypothetical protein
VVSSSAPPDVPAPHGPAQPVPAWLAEILDVVLRDLQRPEPVAIRVGWTPADTDRSGLLWFEEVGHQGMTGVNVPETDDAYLTVLLADALQDQFFSETSAAWGEARPACPGHTHPAMVDLRDGAAW